MSWVVIFSKVAACTSQPVGTRALVAVWQASETSYRKNRGSQLLAVVLWHLVGLLMELAIGDENHSLPLCVCTMWWVMAKPVTYICIMHVLLTNTYKVLYAYCTCSGIACNHKTTKFYCSTSFEHWLFWMCCKKLWGYFNNLEKTELWTTRICKHYRI